MNEATPIFTSQRGDPMGAVLVDFTADWCPPCRAISPILDDIANERINTLDVVRLDVDEHPDIASRHEVYSMPTLVLFVAGVEVARLIGAHPKRSIDEWLDQGLAHDLDAVDGLGDQ